jgi:hypothetical protein
MTLTCCIHEEMKIRGVVIVGASGAAESRGRKNAQKLNILNDTNVVGFFCA